MKSSHILSRRVQLYQQIYINLCEIMKLLVKDIEKRELFLNQIKSIVYCIQELNEGKRTKF